MLLLTLAIIPLSGCLSSDPAAPTTDEPSETPVKHEPVHIDEQIPLATGETGRDWKFTIHPGATAAAVRFEVEGAEGTPVKHETSWCFRLQSDTTSVNRCAAANANLNIQIGVTGLLDDETFYEKGRAAPGTYNVHFDSLPAVGTFHAYVNVQYA